MRALLWTLLLGLSLAVEQFPIMPTVTVSQTRQQMPIATDWLQQQQQQLPLLRRFQSHRRRQPMPGPSVPCSVDILKAAPHKAPSSGSLLETAASSLLETAAGSRADPTGPGSPDGMISHLTAYTRREELNAEEGITVEADAKAARLALAENLPLAEVRSHYFSCVDARADYALLGTPGGDIGEVALALAAVEESTGKQFTRIEVNALLQEYLDAMGQRGKKYLYMHTDEAALQKLKEVTKVEDPMQPATAEERNAVLAAAVKPEHVGCRHLAKLLEGGAGSLVRSELVADLIRAFLNVLFDYENPRRAQLLYVTLRGDFSQAPLAHVFGRNECGGFAPLLVPNPNSGSASTASNNNKASILHGAHGAYYRQDLARFLAWRNADLDVTRLYARIQEKAEEAQKQAETVYGQGPGVDVTFEGLPGMRPFM